MKDCASCASILKQSGYMQNSLLWIPGIENSKSLYIGQNGDDVRSVLSEKSVIFESVSTVGETKDLFDYVIFDNSLDTEQDKVFQLNLVTRYLSENGKIIIIAQNKFGYRGITQIVDGQSSKGCFQLSWKEWNRVLSDYAQSVKAYFPYPDSITADFLFTEKPKRSELLLPDYFYSGPAYQVMDSGKFMQSAFDSDYFEDFANSFMFVIGKPDSFNVEYAKFSRNRKREFQIFTTINSMGTEKNVIKHPIYAEGRVHLQRMVDYQQFTRNYHSDKLTYCAAEMKDDDCFFPFIEGVSLDSELTSAVQNQDFDRIRHIMEIIKEAASFGPECTFHSEKEFLKLFGEDDYSLLEGETSREQSNIDLVPGNIIIGDDGSMTIIDYEWTFPFPIPTKFILFRSMLHSPEFNSITVEMRNRIWDYYGIPEEMQRLFWRMENTFQQYVSNGTLWQKLAEAGGISVPLPDVHTQLIEYTIEQGSEKAHRVFLQNPNLYIKAHIDRNETVHICFEHNAMMEIRSIRIDGEPVEFTTNAVISEGNEYIFTQQPIIRIDKPKGSNLEIDLLIYSYDDPDISTISNLMQTNHHLNISIDQIKEQYSELCSKLGVRVLRKLRLL